MAKKKNGNHNRGNDDTAFGAEGSTGDAMNMSADTGAESTGEDTGIVSQQAHAAADRFRHSAEHLKDQAREQASHLTAKAKEQGQQYVDQTRGRIVEQVTGIGSAIRSAADQLHQNNVGGAATYVESLADQVDRAADWVRNKELADAARDLTDFARRRPEIVLGGMFIAGLAVARFLKASSASTTAGYASDSGSGGAGYTRDSDFETDYDAGSSELGFQESDVYAGSSAPIADVQPTGTMGATDAIGESSSMGITTNDPTGVNAFPTPGTTPTANRGAGSNTGGFNP